jgi:hypothetical protein
MEEIEAYEDRKFDAGEDVSGEVDWEKARRPNLELKRVNVDFPAWVIGALDREAQRPWRDPAGASKTMDR